MDTLIKEISVMEGFSSSGAARKLWFSYNSKIERDVANLVKTLRENRVAYGQKDRQLLESIEVVRGFNEQVSK